MLIAMTWGGGPDGPGCCGIESMVLMLGSDMILLPTGRVCR